MPEFNEDELRENARNLAELSARYPKIPLPTNFMEDHTVVIVMQASNDLGMDLPFEVIHGRSRPARGEMGTLTCTVVVQHPVSKETLGVATTADLPYGLDGQHLGDIPKEMVEIVWQGLSLMTVQRLMIAAFDHAGGRMIEELSGVTDIPSMQAWAQQNIPTPASDDTPGTGMQYMLAAVQAKREGKTAFQVTNYGQAVSHVTNDGWDAYMGWLGEGATFDDQMGRLPEYIKQTYGLVPPVKA